MSNSSVKQGNIAVVYYYKVYDRRALLARVVILRRLVSKLEDQQKQVIYDASRILQSKWGKRIYAKVLNPNGKPIWVTSSDKENNPSGKHLLNKKIKGKHGKK
ncbi:MAG: hypothetical protein U5L10_03425 [Candidatus Moranbacteria bacterium]|nr:hypothetical protein [Candidatus Moranbacteria bacterium]